MVSSFLVSRVGAKVAPRGFKPIMDPTSNKVSINMPLGSWKVLVDPSQEKIETNNIVGLYSGPVMEILIMS